MVWFVLLAGGTKTPGEFRFEWGVHESVSPGLSSFLGKRKDPGAEDLPTSQSRLLPSSESDLQTGHATTCLRMHQNLLGYWSAGRSGGRPDVVGGA